VRFAGYAALFRKPDAAHDTIVPGAFAATLADRSEPLPLYWQHRPDRPIGVVEVAAEDARGLRIIARIENPNSRVGNLLRTKSVSGLSFGYRATVSRQTPHGRLLEAVELFEVSLVTHPLQHGARVHFVSPPSTPSER
jgi:HK97 family phage prohead protease